VNGELHEIAPSIAQQTGDYRDIKVRLKPGALDPIGTAAAPTPGAWQTLTAGPTTGKERDLAQRDQDRIAVNGTEVALAYAPGYLGIPNSVGTLAGGVKTDHMTPDQAHTLAVSMAQKDAEHHLYAVVQPAFSPDHLVVQAVRPDSDPKVNEALRQGSYRLPQNGGRRVLAIVDEQGKDLPVGTVSESQARVSPGAMYDRLVASGASVPMTREQFVEHFPNPKA
jgi:hypothetical protein